MLAMEMMTPLKSSKQKTAAASKIKNKLINTSSFFKVSLKTNNKALAAALGAQKERNRQLEMEIVYLQKQVEALCFELATKKYKHRKLLLILQTLHSSTLQHLDMVADLFSDSDLPKLCEDNNTSSDDADRDAAVGRLRDQFPPQTETAVRLSCALQKVTAELPGNNISADVCSTNQSRARRSTGGFTENADAEKRHSVQPRQTPPTGSSRPSSSLREDVERLSVMFSASGFDMKSVLSLQNGQTSSAPSTAETPAPSPPDAPLAGSSAAETEPEHVSKQEKTLLLNSTMEMTQSDAAEIVTVETKVKTTGRSAKQKGKKNQEQLCGKSSAEVQTAPAGSVSQTDGRPHKDVTELQSPKTQSKSVVTSRIPKLNKCEAGSQQKVKKDKLKSRHNTKSNTESCDGVPPDLDDYFQDRKFPEASEVLRLPPGNDAAEDARPNITCRRSRTKGRSAASLSRKTFVIFPPVSHDRESSRSTAGEEVNGQHEACTDQELQDEFMLFADEVTHPESEHVDRNPRRKVTTTSQKSRCRGTFVVSVDRDSASSYGSAAEPNFIPSAGPSRCEAETPTVLDSSDVLRLSESDLLRRSDAASVQETPSSCKRPWLATLDSSSNHDAAAPDEDCTSGAECQKPKKARREVKSGKKKAAQREEGAAGPQDRKKKKKSSSRRLKSKEKFDPEHGDAAAPLHPTPLHDAPLHATPLHDALLHATPLHATPLHDAPLHDAPLHDSDAPERNRQLDDLHEADSLCDLSTKDESFEHLYDLKRSKSRMAQNLKPYRKTSALRPSTGAGNPRATFVVCRRKTRDAPLNDTPASDVFHTLDEPDRQDLLTDEVPPWLDLDVSIVDTEAGSLLATPRRETAGRAAAAVVEKSPGVSAEPTPAGRALKSLTNTVPTPDSANGGRTRRRKGVVSYKEPRLNSKMRRGDKFTDSEFLSSPVFKDGKKKQQKLKKKKLERSILVD